MKIKKDIKIIDKIGAINEIIDLSFVEREGRLWFNSALHKVAKIYGIVKLYSSYKMVSSKETGEDEKEFEVDDIFASFDKIVKNDIYNQVISEIGEEELAFVEELIEDGIFEQERIIEHKNSILGIIKEVFGSLSDNLPEIMNAIKDVDPKKLEKLVRFVK